ncbi:uncharacterized protein LOC134957786 isoform X2 [Pseudophryne corroboree]|uniref:uncharacterized protein LOC134957786 isoform X2 n=1 Tax=Pseudophryne corroboree TaxID=495146 RepID=UPI0030817A8C
MDGALQDKKRECFICREEERKGQEELQNFCDCTDLTVHGRCLLTWIQKGSGNDNRYRCSACTAKYHLQEGSVWKKFLCQWKSLRVFALMLAVIITIPFSVHYLETLPHPQPNLLFKVVAVCAGIIAEIILLRWFIGYCYNQYNKAKISSYSIKARPVEECGRVGQPSLEAHNSSLAMMNRTEGARQTAVLPKDALSLKLSV